MKFNKGDRVSIEATVKRTDVGLTKDLVEILPDGFSERGTVLSERLTLVKRYEKPLQEPPVGASFPVGIDNFIYVRTAKEWLAIDPYGDQYRMNQEGIKVVYIHGDFQTMLEKDGEHFRNAVEAYWKAREDEDW